MKKVLLCLLALCLFLLSSCQKVRGKDPDQPPTPVGNQATEPEYPVDEGEIEGSDLRWEMYGNGTLYIKGNGAMPDFVSVSPEDSDLPWNAYRQGNIDTSLKITRIVVENGVTTVSENAFAECLSLTQVTLPESLISIGYCAFTNCRRLTAVNGGIGVRIIDENAFQGCTDLRVLSISAPLCEVRHGAFDGCRDLALHFTGTEAEWLAAKAGLTVESGNDAFTNATLRYYPK